MEKSFSESYKQAGVDITAGYKAVELMKKHIARTVTAGAASDIGGFGGLFELDLTGMTRPVLVSGTDGVGTKLKYAFMLDKHDTIGIDCVAMCVNDVICCGAKPLFFLDYIACGKNVPERIAAIVSGVAEGCVQSGAALIGGETAEMPGFYPEDEYDLAGFAVGVVDRSKVLDNSKVAPGDVVIALPSSGVHSNGFSLVRKIFEGRDMTVPVEELGGKSLGETLLTPTRIYVKPMLALFEKVTVKAVSHITGGGFFEIDGGTLQVSTYDDGTWHVDMYLQDAADDAVSGDVGTFDVELAVASDGCPGVIGELAFAGCDGIATVDLPASTREIQFCAFAACGDLSRVDLPDGLTSVYPGAFAYSGMTDIAWPRSCPTVPAHAFAGCERLRHVELPEGVHSIESNAFAGCTGLRTVDIPASCTKIALDAFDKGVELRRRG